MNGKPERKCFNKILEKEPKKTAVTIVSNCVSLFKCCWQRNNLYPEAYNGGVWNPVKLTMSPMYLVFSLTYFL